MPHKVRKTETMKLNSRIHAQKLCIWEAKPGKDSGCPKGGAGLAAAI